jgi:carboxylesterase
VSFVTLVAALLAGWFARRSIGVRMERAMLIRLPLDADGVVHGAAGVVRSGSPERAVLILHGFGDTPQTLYYLVDHLHSLGFTVHAPLLPGHGRTLPEFGASGADAWLEAAARELASLRNVYDFVGLVGVSMGGALATILASGSAAISLTVGPPASPGDEHTDAPGPRPDAMVLLAPYLSMRPRAERLAILHRMVSAFASYLPSREAGSILDPAERARNRGFGVVTPRLLHELRRVVQRARRALPAVMQPTLVIQSRNDNRIDASAAVECFERLGATEKRFVWTEGSGHVITVDHGRERVLTLTGEWLLARAEIIAPRANDPTTPG